VSALEMSRDKALYKSTVTLWRLLIKAHVLASAITVQVVGYVEVFKG